VTGKNACPWSFYIYVLICFDSIGPHTVSRWSLFASV